MRRLPRDERGVALPSPLVMLSVVAVAMAGIAFVATGDQDRGAVQNVSRPAPTDRHRDAPPPRRRS